MAKLEFRRLSDSDNPLYDELILNHGTLFAQRDWLRLFDGEATILGLFNGSGKLVGGFPILTKRLFGLRTVLKPPFNSSCGPYFSDEINKSKGRIESRRFFLTKICEYLGRKSPAICCLSFDTSIKDCLPFRWSGYKVVPAYTYRIQLSSTEIQIKSSFSSTRRRNIRAAERDSIEIQALDSYDIIERLAQKTFGRQGKKLPKHILHNVLYEFANPSNSFAFSAYKDEKPIAGVLCIFDERTAYYLIGGYDSAEGHSGAGAACMQEAIFKAKSLGLETFDFEGSVIPAIERYFRGFGGELTPYFTANRAWFPIELLLKVRKRELF